MGSSKFSPEKVRTIHNRHLTQRESSELYGVTETTWRNYLITLGLKPHFLPGPEGRLSGQLQRELREKGLARCPHRRPCTISRFIRISRRTSSPIFSSSLPGRTGLEN